MGIDFTLKIGVVYDYSDMYDDKPMYDFRELASFDIGNLRELRDIIPDMNTDCCGTAQLTVTDAITWLTKKREDCFNYKMAVASLMQVPQEAENFCVKISWG